jgi:hypothetical protein
MARESLKDFLRKDPYGSSTSTEKIDYVVDQGGDSSSDPYVDDLKKDLKEALGRFTHHTTAQGINSNDYPISDKTEEFSLRDDDGTPSAYTSGDGGEAKRYLDDNTGGEATIDNPKISSYFQKISGGGDPKTRGGGTFSAGQLGDIVDKSGKDRSLSGHDALGRAADEVIISPVLATTNRFDPGKNTPYAGRGETLSNNQVDSLKFASKQNKLGVYNEDSAAVKIKEMKDIGEKMVIMATGHTPGGFNLGGLTQEALLPSLAQLGASKVPRHEMYAKNRDNPGFGAGNPDTVGVATENPGYRDKSFGAMNSPLEPFSAIPKMGMTTMTLALVIAVEILVEIVAEIMEMLCSSPMDNTTRGDGQSMRAGHMRNRLGRRPNKPPTAMIVPPHVFGVKHNEDGMATMAYGDAVTLGIDVFFGTEDGDIRPQGGGLFGALPGGKNVNDSPGYYSIVFRAVIRSTIEIGLTIGDAFKGGFFAILQGIAEVLATIRNSKLMAYINLLASLGEMYKTVLDQNLTEYQGPAQDLALGDTLVGGISALSALPLAAGPTQKYRVGKSRYDGKKSLGEHDTLVWGTGQLPSSYLFSAKVRNYGAASGLRSAEDSVKMIPTSWTNQAYASQGFTISKVNDVAESRLSAEVVRATENHLDSEYMPFYFHDLRTNEIIAFHAFLTSLSDSYSVSWDQTKAYGRADPVMAYNSTNRSIGMTFWVLATNPSDFDEMWWKINKLVTMVYPQYSGGTLLTTEGGNTITAPFSQIPTASPIIRLRLGDLIKSNYSKFALSRLFGFENTDPASVNSEPSVTDPVATQTDFTTSSDPPLFGTPDTMFRAKSNQRSGAYNDPIGCVMDIEIPKDVTFAINDAISSLDSLAEAMAAGDLLGFAKYGNVAVKVQDPPEADDQQIETNAQFITYLEEFGFDPNKIIMRWKVLQKSSLFDVIGTPLDDLTLPIAEGYADIVQGFMQAEQNPIVKSFESTRGKGLAGALTQLDFNWMDGPGWVTASPGSNAPKACQITISMSPMHDIAPGIDQYGVNRAPIYNVGQTSRAWGGDPYDE